jgi:GMP synthase-like glutamine amidotransferase
MRAVPERVAFLQHSATDVPGVLGDHLGGLGLAVTTHRADHGATALPGSGSFDLLVVLGSIESATDGSVPWIAPERRLVAASVEHDVPVLGVCFGGQLLAQVLGGAVSRAVRPEVGWRRLDTIDPSRVPAGPWLDWHEDAFTCPPGAEPVARTDVSLHAFVQGPHTGLQFHPEVTRTVVEAWIGDARERAHLPDEEVEALLGGFDPDGRGPDGQTAALVDAFLTRVDTSA